MVVGCGGGLWWWVVVVGCCIDGGGGDRSGGCSGGELVVMMDDQHLLQHRLRHFQKGKCSLKTLSIDVVVTVVVVEGLWQ